MFAFPLSRHIAFYGWIAVGVLSAAFLAICVWRILRIKNLFQDLPLRMLMRLLRKPSLLRGNTMHTVVCLSCRLSCAADATDAQALALRLEKTLARFFAAITSEGGAVTRIGADGFLAFWNAPISDPQGPAKACRAALAMLRCLRPCQGTRTNAAPDLDLAIGLTKGPALAGIFAGRYGAFGACIRRADELCRACKESGFAIIADSAIAEAAQAQFALLEIETRALPGNEAEKLHALLGNQATRANPKFRALTTFHARIFDALDAGEFQAARSLVAQARKLSGANQVLYDRYEARIAGAMDAHTAPLRRAG